MLFYIDILSYYSATPLYFPFPFPDGCLVSVRLLHYNQTGNITNHSAVRPSEDGPEYLSRQMVIKPNAK